MTSTALPSMRMSSGFSISGSSSDDICDAMGAAAISTIIQAAIMADSRPTSRARGTSPFSAASRRRFSVGSSVFCSWSCSDMRQDPDSQPPSAATKAVSIAPAVSMNRASPAISMPGVATK